MPPDHPTVFLRKPGATPKERRVARPRESEVDALLLDRMRRRLALVAGLMALLSIVAICLMTLVPTMGPSTERLNTGLPTLFVQLAAGVLVGVLAWRKLLPGRYLRAIGLFYQVLVCWLLAVGHTSGDLSRHGAVPTVTFVEVMIVFFPLIVPNKPRLVVVAATLSAATRPLAALMLGNHYQLPDPWLIISTAAPAIACVMALVGAKVIYGLGTEVAAAKRMGSYQLEERLGKGGMGEVWRANHRLLARPAAVKFIRPETTRDDPSAAANAMKRFSREVLATSLLESVHTVNVYDFGQTDDGTFFYVMELLDGIDLDELVRRHGSIPPERAIHLILGACHSLAEAHDSGVVHRDIKPANLVACRYGRDLDLIKVLDFGLVALSSRDAEDASLTATNTVVGTPAFMAPESARGEEVDHRADLYALGCVMYWLIAGRLVFQEDTAMALAIAHATKAPPRLEDICDADIPVELSDLLISCLEKDPEDRPQDADALGRALTQVPLADAWTPQRARQWWAAKEPRTTKDSAAKTLSAAV